MSTFEQLLRAGTANAWLFVPTAVALGALHGLEPGHSKTMMASFIVAVRGTVAQAVLLGLSAAVSHSLIVWSLAFAALTWGDVLIADHAEPYFLAASGAVVLGVALWMFLRARREDRLASGASEHRRDHRDETHRIDTGDGVATLSVFEDGVPPRFRLRFERPGDAPPAQAVSIVTERAGGGTQRFGFVDRGGFLESVDEIPEPHEFTARLGLAHDGHVHDYDLTYAEHDHAHGPDAAAPGYQDAHERAHADDIRLRFAGRAATTPQIVLFGLTGGLLPCPAAIAVVLVCLQLKEFALGVGMVAAFSTGLALTLVAVGAAAAWGTRHVARRTSWFDRVGRKLPYLSSGFIALLGLFTFAQGILGIGAR